MDIVETLITGVYTLLLILDGIVYNLVNYFYEIFLFLAKINIFSNTDYEEIVQSIYIVLGVIMLFILAYSLLKAIINPDSFAKGESSFPNLVKNILTSLIIIILLPTVFSVAFNIQNVFLNNNTIFKIILGDNSSTDTIEKSGGQMSYYTFRAFFHESEEWCTSDGNNYSVGTLRTDGSLSDDCKNFITNSDGEDLMTVDNQVYSGTRSFSAYSSFASAVNEGQIDYMFIISTLAGLFLVYVLLSFCFDLAVRVVKLAFYQIIAPIPVVCRILPGGKLKDTFSKWTKQVISLFLEVFIRIGVMCIGVLLLTKIIDNFSTIDFDLLDGFAQKQIVQALLIMGVVIFIRQCPKLIGELFGLDTGGMKLGIMDKLAMGGGLIVGAAAGGLATAGIRNYNATRAAGGGVFSSIKSAIGGAGSAAVRSGYNARGAKKFGDVRSAASAGAAAAGAAKTRRAAKTARYKANGQNALTGRFTDMVDSVKDWATGGIGQFEDRIKMGNEFKSSGDAIFDEAGKILSKNSNNVDMVASMIDNNGKSKFKGDTNGDLLKLYQEYSGMSLSAIEADINRQANIVDFSALVNRADFEKEQIDLATGKKSKVFDARGYQDAIDREARKHAAKMANLRSMYNQLEKETKMNIVNVALDSDMKIDGIDDSKLQSIRDKVDTFKEQYSQVGSAVVDPASNKSYKEISQSGDIAHQIDDIATAFANISSAASADAAKHRQAMEARKGNK